MNNRKAIREFLRARGAFGATCDEVEIALDLPHQTASAALHEMAKIGKVRRINKRRLTRRNVWAGVYGTTSSQK